MNKDKRPVKASSWEGLAVRESGPLMGGVMLSKSLIPFSVDGWGCVPPHSFGLRPNYGRGNGSNRDLLQKGLCQDGCIQCPWPHCRPPLTHISAGDSWTLTGKSGSVSCGITVPFSWVLVHTKFCLCPPRVFPQCCGSSVIKSHQPSKSNSLMVLSTFARSLVGKSLWTIELLQQ